METYVKSRSAFSIDALLTARRDSSSQDTDDKLRSRGPSPNMAMGEVVDPAPPPQTGFTYYHPGGYPIPPSMANLAAMHNMHLLQRASLEQTMYQSHYGQNNNINKEFQLGDPYGIPHLLPPRRSTSPHAGLSPHKHDEREKPQANKRDKDCTSHGSYSSDSDERKSDLGREPVTHRERSSISIEGRDYEEHISQLKRSIAIESGNHVNSDSVKRIRAEDVHKSAGNPKVSDDNAPPQSDKADDTGSVVLSYTSGSDDDEDEYIDIDDSGCLGDDGSTVVGDRQDGDGSDAANAESGIASHRFIN